MSSSPKIKVVRLAHVHYQHPQLDKAVQFLKDFGLFEVKRVGSRVYFAGFGVDPYIYIAEQAPGSRRAFIGGAWVVHAEKDLQAAAAHPDASGITDDEGPGGGKIVSTTDPNGYRISFVYGQKLRSDPAVEETDLIVGSEPPVLNLALEKPRQGAFRRFNVGPSPVHKLGHYGYIVPQTVFQKTFDWYTSLINVVPTDAVFDPKTGEDATCFMHIDLGATYTDHHSFFLGSNPTAKPAFVHHSSFEINDMDTQALGHKWLSEKGYTNCWGIGRHVLGSQIFDYWFDTSGNILEHYSDGDIVNKDTPYTRSPEAPDSLYIWGPNLPLGFVTGNPDDANKEAGPPPPAPVAA
ncbi:2,3-dihydroxybiphenyl-1,2-dioxygenase [Fusarium keratoplasticum]|nr:2,3-dihydroxybiphenyl-1,2-dioxygenase [Fusarium keratoplasticum]